MLSLLLAAAVWSPGIDWEAFVVRARGMGPPSPMAQSAGEASAVAEANARKAVLEALAALVRPISIDGTTSVGSLLDAEDPRALAALARFSVSTKRYYSDGGVELEAELSLSELAAATITKAGAPDAGRGKPAFTGLVIDARGKALPPVLRPRVLDEQGAVVAHLSELRIAGYARAPDAAAKSPVVGGKPLVLKAARVAGPDVVLSGADARRALGVAPDGALVLVTGNLSR